MFKTNMRKALSLILVFCMVFGIAACGKKENNNSNTTPTAAPTQAADKNNEGNGDTTPTTEPEATPVPWDASYIDGDDYKAYIAYDLDLLYADIEDQLTAAQKTSVSALVESGKAAIEAAATIAEVRAAYDNAYASVLNAIPCANGIKSFAGENNDERTKMLGLLETYAIKVGTTGISLFENGSYVMYNPRVTLGTENYIVGYGFGTLAEGSITADLDYETNAAWKRYYHTFEASDPGTLNYLNDQGSQVSDFYSYIAASYFTNFMNETKDGYDWVPELAMEKPVAVNAGEDGTATKWRFQVRTGAEGLKYTTGSSIPSRAAFNNRPVALEDYITPFKLLLTQSNQLYRGSELANSTTGAIVGAKEYYNGTAEGYNEELWNKVGVKVYEENGKSYFEVEFTQPLTRFYAMYYISSSLYQPVPQEFLDLVTVQNYLGFNNDATETPVDNSLALGAYYLEAYNSDQQVVYKKNPNYVYADTKYSIPGVHIKIFTAAAEDTTAGINEFLAGHFDASGIPQTMLDEYRNDPRTRTTTGSSVFKLNVNATDAETWEYLFGEEGVVTQTPKADYWEVEPALGNAHFVKALKYSIDRLTFANARGSIPSVDYLSSNYMSDPENGIAYSSTEAHKSAVASLLEGTDGYGYSLELARDYFRMALAELEADGAYTPGTKENPTEIHIEIAWMYPTHEENYHNEIKNFFETAFNDDSVSGGAYKLSVDFWVGNAWSDVYYNKMMPGQFDIGFGSITGNSLNPLDFVSVLSSDQEISGSFTLNWGVDTNNPDAYPIVYKGERYSYDAFVLAANTQAIVSEGKNKQAATFSYENITKNADGTYTGALEITAALPAQTTVEVTDVVCCNYERYRNGDGAYDEASVEFTTEDKGNGVTRVTFTVPADLAADYAIGSGTSENPAGATGFDFYYTITLDGNASDTYYSVEDNFVVE
ncbi:MAG: ABC transporter substrate-binding protein [Lachnospiraceae bacterium]